MPVPGKKLKDHIADALDGHAYTRWPHLEEITTSWRGSYEAYVEQLAKWRKQFGFGWVSDHLAAVRVRDDGPADHHAGASLPLAWDTELLDLLVPRLRRAGEILGDPLLLENGATHIAVAESDTSETDFLNQLTRRSGCRLLLDLHNLYVNCVNLGVDGFAFLDALDLGAVGEVHVAGGNVLDGVYLDSHAGPCPPAVWNLLDAVIGRAPALNGITFEFHESYWGLLGEQGPPTQLARMRRAWDEHEASVHVA